MKEWHLYSGFGLTIILIIILMMLEWRSMMIRLEQSGKLNIYRTAMGDQHIKKKKKVLRKKVVKLDDWKKVR